MDDTTTSSLLQPDAFFADPVAAAKAAMLMVPVGPNNKTNNNTNNTATTTSTTTTTADDPIDIDIDDSDHDDDAVAEESAINKDNDDEEIVEEAEDDDDDDEDVIALVTESGEKRTDNNTNDYDENAETESEDEEEEDDEEEDDGEDDDDDDQEIQEEVVEEKNYASSSSSSSSDPTAITSATTVINGKGIWHSWTRNFSTPLLALLDLLDNAFDATSLTHPGRIYVQPDIYYSNAKQQQKLVQSGFGGVTTGVTLWNNSVYPIKPLQKVLEVYTSLKGANANSIGENGVGLKQGCATLSNLSFCIAKSTKTISGGGVGTIGGGGTSSTRAVVVYSMGVIAYQLQTSLGCSLPSFTFTSTDMDELRNEMIQKFTVDYPAVGECIVQYGAMTDSNSSGNNDDDTTHQQQALLYKNNAALKGLHLRIGIDRLLEKFRYMNQSGWEHYDHVFGLIVDHLKHGEQRDHHHHRHHHADKNKNEPPSSSNTTLDQPSRVNKLLETLYVDLPKRYLHIPTALLDVRVGGRIVNFNYWQPRLVEMAQFDLQIHTSANMIDFMNAKRHREKPKQQPKPTQQPDSIEQSQVDSIEGDGISNINQVDTMLGSAEDPNWYTLRVYTGFDALRVSDDRAQKTASMYIYSRQSGRLIKSIMDCRGELGLTSGGSGYCQGLTLIVDDCNANFPLNPTKQDVAFGEQSNGETHKRNLYIWLNAAMRLYYQYYKDQICDKRKQLLTNALKALAPMAQQLIQKSSTSFQSLSDCQFTKFHDYTTNFVMNHGQAIKLASFNKLFPHPGKDSRLQLPPVPAQTHPEPKKSRSTNSNTKKKVQSNADIISPRRLNSRSAAYAFRAGHVDYNDGDDDDVDGFYNNGSNTSKRQARRRHSQQDAQEEDPTDASGTKRKRARRIDISESKQKDHPQKYDVSQMMAKIQALEDENRHLKKEMHQMQESDENLLLKRNQQIEKLQGEKLKLKHDIQSQKEELKILRKQLKEALQQQQSISTPDNRPQSMSTGSKGGGNGTSPGNTPDFAKMVKRIKNLNSNIDVLKNENEDLKEQIKGLESTIHRKDKTIQAQRKLIDERNKEDDEEEDVQEQSIERDHEVDSMDDYIGDDANLDKDDDDDDDDMEEECL